MFRILFLKAAFTVSFVTVLFSFVTQSQARKVVPESRIAITQSFSPIVKKTAPAVVNVYIRHRKQRRERYTDQFFERFLGDAFGVPRKRRENSLGSGVIVSSGGLVVTNYHVIKDGKKGEIKIAFADKREYEARLVLVDKKTDLAILRILSRNERFPFLDIANSDNLEVGDLVLAIGNPFGVGKTVTSGIISALARTQVGVSHYQSFIQTDAAINPGNSGGALVDIHGKLIGINTAIFSKSGGSLGIGFAIPSNTVQLVVNASRTGETVKRPWFGASLQNVTQDIALSLGLEQPTGVLVADVMANSPAAKAGIKGGDVILAVDGHGITNPQTFSYHYSTKGVRGNVVMKILRGTQKLRRNVRLMQAPEIPPRNAQYIRGNHPFNGAEISNLSPALAEELSQSLTSGIIITNLRSRSSARRIGLKKHDIIIAINRKEIDTIHGLKKIIRYNPRVWRLTVLRGNQEIDFVIGR